MGTRSSPYMLAKVGGACLSRQQHSPFDRSDRSSVTPPPTPEFLAGLVAGSCSQPSHDDTQIGKEETWNFSSTLSLSLDSAHASEEDVAEEEPMAVPVPVFRVQRSATVLANASAATAAAVAAIR